MIRLVGVRTEGFSGRLGLNSGSLSRAMGAAAVGPAGAVGDGRVYGTGSANKNAQCHNI